MPEGLDNAKAPRGNYRVFCVFERLIGIGACAHCLGEKQKSRLNAPMDQAKEDLRLSTSSGQRNGHDVIMSDLERRVDGTRAAALGGEAGEIA